MFLKNVTVVIGLIATCASAQESKNLISIQKAQDKIIHDSTKKISAISRAYVSMDKKKYAQAIKEIAPLQANAEFKDYFHFITGMAELKKMEAAYKAKNLRDALTAGESAVTNLKETPVANVYSPLAKRSDVYLAKAELTIADIYLKQRNKKQARLNFENAFQRLAEHSLLSLVPRHFVQRYVTFCDEKPDELCTSWEIKLSSVYPKSEKSKVFARLNGISIPSVDRQTSIPYKTDLDLQEFTNGFALYLKDQYDEAFNIWYELLKKYPRTSIKLRTKFWMGRAAQKAKQDAKAETLYREVIKEIPFSFYALMASWYSGIDILRTIDANLPMSNPDVQLPNPADVFHVRRAEILIASKAYEWARFELREVKPRDSMPNEFLIYLAALNYVAENHQTSFTIISELGNRGYTGLYSSYGEKMVFPTTHINLVEGPAKHNKLDPYFVLSVIKQESAFNEEAISTSPAFGLMQIIAPTARDLDPNIEIFELFDSEKNITLGSKYLRQLLKKYDGNPIWTLAGYNAGPGNADRWKKETENAKSDLTPEEMIEFITFRETHDYVQNIVRNYYWYNRRLKGEGFVNFQALLQQFSAN